MTGDGEHGEKGLRVLVVEDEMLIALDLELLLRSLGHDVVGLAADLQECKSIAAGARPDLALMDYRLKGGDSGADAARWLREELDTPCIFVSANLDEERRKQLAPLDPIAFVGKPILPTLVADALAKARLRIRGS